MIKQIQIALVALFIGIGIGYFTKGQFVKAERTDALIESQKEIVNDVIQAEKTNERVETAVAKTEQKSNVAKQTIRKIPFVVVEPGNCPANPEPEVASVSRTDDVLHLGRGAVSVLDAARENVDLDPAAISNEESRAASDVTLDEFVQNDLEVVRMYHELSERHNTLVEFVSSKITICQ